MSYEWKIHTACATSSESVALFGTDIIGSFDADGAWGYETTEALKRKHNLCGKTLKKPNSTNTTECQEGLSEPCTHQNLSRHIFKKNHLMQRDKSLLKHIGLKTEWLRAGGARGSCWSSCMWLQGGLIWLCPTVQGLWWTAATTNEQFAYVWPLAPGCCSITVARASVRFLFCTSPSSPIHPWALVILSTLSCFPSFFFLFFTVLSSPTIFHLLSFLYLSSSFFSANTTDTGLSKALKCFYIKGNLASHSWCGGGSACCHRGSGREWWWRVPTARLSSSLVPLGEWCMFLWVEPKRDLLSLQSKFQNCSDL